MCSCYLGGSQTWFYLGGHWFYSEGGMNGFIRGACMVLFMGGHVWFYSAGGACVVFSVFSDTMRYGQ